MEIRHHAQPAKFSKASGLLRLKKKKKTTTKQNTHQKKKTRKKKIIQTDQIGHHSALKCQAN